MNSYEHHIGDYARGTAHLTMLEDGALRRLLDRYYCTEQGIPAVQAHRIARAHADAEVAAVDTVLREFFTLEEGTWRNRRVEEEIIKIVAAETRQNNNKERQKRFRERQRAAAENQPEGAPALLPRYGSVTRNVTSNVTPALRNVTPSVHDRQGASQPENDSKADKSEENQPLEESLDSAAQTVYPRARAIDMYTVKSTDLEKEEKEKHTKEKEEKPAPQSFAPLPRLLDLQVPASVAADWLALRKTRKAAVTATALNGIVREANKAGWSLTQALIKSCERGWTGFKADWVRTETPPPDPSSEPPSADIIELPSGQRITKAQQAFVLRMIL